MRTRRQSPARALVVGLGLLAILPGCRRPPTVAESVAVANAKMEAGDVAAAIALLEEAERREPGQIAVLEPLAFAYGQADRHSEAALGFQQLAKLAPPGNPYLLYAASAFSTAGNRAAAAQAYADHLATRPDDAPTWTALGRTLLEGGSPAAAVDAFLRSYDLRPTGPLALEIGRLFLQLGNGPQADAWFRRAMAGDMESGAEARRGLMETAILLREPGNAHRWLAELDQFHPGFLDSSPSAARRGELEAWRRQQDEVERVAREAAQRRAAAEAEARRRLEEQEAAAVAARKAEEEAARLAAEAAAAGAPADTGAPASDPSATASPVAGTTVDAAPPARPVVASLPDGPAIRMRLARQKVEAGDPAGAAAVLREAVSEFPDDATLWSGLAEQSLAAGDNAWASAASLEALRLAPGNPAVRQAWVRVARATLPEPRFVEELGRLRDRHLDDPELNLALARAYRQRGAQRSYVELLLREFLRFAPADHPERAAVQAELGLR